MDYKWCIYTDKKGVSLYGWVDEDNVVRDVLGSIIRQRNGSFNWYVSHKVSPFNAMIFGAEPSRKEAIKAANEFLTNSK